MFFKYRMYNNPRLAEQLMFGSTDHKIIAINEKLWKKFDGNRFDYYLNIVKICGKPDTPRARYVIAMAYSWNSTIYCREAIKYLELYLSKPLYKDKCVNNETFTQSQRTKLHLCEMYSYLGKAYRDNRDYKNAIKNYSIALSYNPNRTSPYLCLAETYYYNNETQKAILTLEKAKQSKYAKIVIGKEAPISEYIDLNIINKKIEEYKQRLYIETTYPYKQNQVRELVMAELQKNNININFTQPKLKLICEKFNLKDKKEYFYKHPDSDTYRCSKALADILINLLINNPNLIDEIKNLKKQNNIKTLT